MCPLRVHPCQQLHYMVVWVDIAPVVEQVQLCEGDGLMSNSGPFLNLVAWLVFHRFRLFERLIASPLMQAIDSFFNEPPHKKKT